MIDNPIPQPPVYNDPPPAYNQAEPPAYEINSNAFPITIRFTENPMQLQCPKCSATIITRLHYKVGTMTWFICLGFCLFW